MIWIIHDITKEKLEISALLRPRTVTDWQELLGKVIVFLDPDIRSVCSCRLDMYFCIGVKAAFTDNGRFWGYPSASVTRLTVCGAGLEIN